MDYIVIFDFVLKSIAYLFGICFCIYLIVFEIKTDKMNKKCIRKLREIERSYKIEDENVKDFVRALIDEMEEQLTM